MRLAVELPVVVFQIVNITARAKETIKWKDFKNISPIGESQRNWIYNVMRSTNLNIFMMIWMKLFGWQSKTTLNLKAINENRLWTDLPMNFSDSEEVDLALKPHQSRARASYCEARRQLCVELVKSFQIFSLSVNQFYHLSLIVLRRKACVTPGRCLP